MIADDYFELWLNGQFVTNAYLQEHVANGEAFPIVADFTPYLQAGENVLAIRANDGSCQLDPATNTCPKKPGVGISMSRSYKYVFFDGIVSSLSVAHQGHDRHEDRSGKREDRR